jgi:glycerate 2-kinase
MPRVSDALGIARAALRAVSPERAIRRHLRLRGAALHVGRVRWRLVEVPSVRVVAIGKAASRMYDAAWGVLGKHALPGIAVLRAGDPRPSGPARVFFGDHPIPGPGSQRAGAAVMAFLRALPEAERILFLLSGGGSALCELAAPGLRLSDVAATTRVLLRSGMPIGAMNTIRRRISSLKGGGLARAAKPRSYATLAISDVVGDRPSDIASGPTVSDPTDFRDAWRHVERYGIRDQLPIRVIHHLQRPARTESHRRLASEVRVPFGGFRIIARNRDAVEGAASKARSMGYSVTDLGSAWTGDTLSTARRMLGRVLATYHHRSRDRLACFVAGGETTETIGPAAGVGGRNQEFALSCAKPISGMPAVVLSIGTDGVDGPTPAAGGWVDGRTWGRAERLGVDIAGTLRRHDSYPALGRLGGLVVTGPTGTNVTDLHVILLGNRGGTGGNSPRSAAPSTPRRRS